MNEQEVKPAIPVFSSLMQKLTLVTIVMPKMDFALAGGCTLPQTSYEAKINRSPVRLQNNDNQVCIEVGFQVQGISKETEIFQGHFHFLIIFSHENKDEVTALLENEEVRNVLTGSQTDKLVWSYLRRALLQVVVDAGLPPIVLPLYK